MKYTVVSAAYANDDCTSAVLITAEAGAVAVSAVDTPDEWAALHSLASDPKGGVTIAAYSPPPPPEPAAPSPDQIRALLKMQGKTDVQIDALFALAAAI